MAEGNPRYTVTAQIEFHVHAADMGEAVTETHHALSLVRNGLPCLVTELHIEEAQTPLTGKEEEDG